MKLEKEYKTFPKMILKLQHLDIEFTGNSMPYSMEIRGNNYYTYGLQMLLSSCLCELALSAASFEVRLSCRIN